MKRETVRARLPLNAAALLSRLGGKDVGMASLPVSLTHVHQSGVASIFCNSLNNRLFGAA